MAITPPHGGGAIRIRDEAELGMLPTLPPGTIAERAAVGGEVWRYYAVGSPPMAVRARLGWTQENVWLREEKRTYILGRRPNLVTDLEAAIAHVLAHSLSVHTAPDDPSSYYCIADGASLRAAGLLQSRRTKLLDLGIEVRTVLGGSYPRVYHFSPATKNLGGRQLWP